jgi:DNA-binding transcriptional regulator YiaG
MVTLVTELREYRPQLELTHVELAVLLEVPLNSLRMWDSGLRPTPAAILECARCSAAEAVREREPVTLPQLANALGVHVRMLQAAARLIRRAIAGAE